MKKLLLLLFLLPAFSFAQDLSTHIPKRSTYVVAINPAAHLHSGDVSQVGQLEMFTRSNDYGRSGFDYLYGDDGLGETQQAAFRKMFSDIFASPAITGVDSLKKIFIYNDTPDSIHYWAYLVPLNNSKVFGEYVTTKLFTKKPAIDKGSGFSAVNAERFSIGWTDSYAIILLADFNYSGTYDNPFSIERDDDMLLDSIRMADSMIAVEYAMAYSDTSVSEARRKERSDALTKDANRMLEKLANDSTPEEEVVVDYYSGYYGISASEDDGTAKRDSLMLKKAFAQLKRLINMNYEESVEDLPQFKTVLSENSDAVYWYNYGELMQQTYERNMQMRRQYTYYLNAGMQEDTSMIQNMWEGSYIASLVNFEGDVATMDQRMYFSPAMHEHTKGLYSGKVYRKMFRYVRGENLMGFMAMSVDMEKFMKFYGSVYREMMSNSLMGMYGNYYMAMWDMMRIFLDEKTMYNLLDGKFLFAVTDLKQYTSSYITYDYDENFNKTEIRKERTEIRPEFILVAGIGKEKKAKQLIEIIERMGGVKQQNSQYYLINTPGEYDIKMFLAIQNGMLIITNNEDLMINHLKKGYSKKLCMKRNLRKLGRKSPLVGYWDGPKSIELVKKNRQATMSESDKESLDILEHEVNSGTIIGKRSKEGVQRIETKIVLTPVSDGKKQTSFVRFFKLLNSLYLVRSHGN